MDRGVKLMKTAKIINTDTMKYGRRIAAEWLARRTLKSQVPGSIPGSGKAHVEWKGYSITKQKPSSARGSFVSFSANSKLAPILGHARRFIRRLRHILNIVHELIIRCEEGNKIILYASMTSRGIWELILPGRRRPNIH